MVFAVFSTEFVLKRSNKFVLCFSCWSMRHLMNVVLHRMPFKGWMIVDTEVHGSFYKGRYLPLQLIQYWSSTILFSLQSSIGRRKEKSSPKKENGGASLKFFFRSLIRRAHQEQRSWHKLNDCAADLYPERARRQRKTSSLSIASPPAADKSISIVYHEQIFQRGTSTRWVTRSLMYADVVSWPRKADR